jgi:antitoxin component YwqK of YwqJK toxin-antitoxin module
VVSGEGQSRTLSGPFIAYWPNGVKQAEGQMVKNERVGTWTTFDKNGVKLTTVSFKNDKWTGERTHFFPSGQKKMVETFDNGVLVAVQSFNQLGQPVESGIKTN